MSDPAAPMDALQLASLIAHQLQGPVSAASMLIKALLGGYQGPLTDEQKDFISRAAARCDEALASAKRMLSIATALKGGTLAKETCELAAVVRRLHQEHTPQAAARDISLLLDVGAEPVQVGLSAAALTECLEAILNNAFKYTPDHGRIRISVRLVEGLSQGASAAAEGAQTVGVTVEDSGVGIAEQDRERVFAGFYRTDKVRASAQVGTGLGLWLVRLLAQAVGGDVQAGKSEFGGAAVSLSLPVRGAAAAPAQKRGMRVVIIGGVAAGPKVASKVNRLDADAEVTIIERGKFMSYAGCGLPYYVSGQVKSQKELMSTAAGVVRDAVFFQNVRNVQVRNATEALRIDREAKRVFVRDLVSGLEGSLDYDKLVLATGALPIKPQVPGVDLPNVFTLHGVHDAEGIKSALAQVKARDVVIVGGGLLGVEFTSCLAAKGCRVTIVERRPRILPILDWEMAALVEKHLESHGVRVLAGTNVKSFEGSPSVSSVVTDKGTLAADLVILGIGVRPNVALARDAGLEIGVTGGIKVDDRLRTGDPDIFAAGDCLESRSLLTNKPWYVPMGSLANKHGRVVAVNVCGGDERFPGVLGSTVCHVFDYCVARTGLTESQARGEGFEVVTALAPAPDAEHFMPSAVPLLLKLVVDAKSRRLIGAQGVGPGRADKRIDVAATAITGGLTVDQIANADLCYAPQYAPAMDNIITAANVARNKLDGRMTGISAAEVRRMLDEGQDFVFLDVRSPGEYEQVRLAGATLIPLGSLRGRLDELPRNKPIVTFCNISLRGYEAALILKANGFEDVRVLDGGIDMWPFKRLH